MPPSFEELVKKVKDYERRAPSVSSEEMPEEVFQPRQIVGVSPPKFADMTYGEAVSEIRKAEKIAAQRHYVEEMMGQKGDAPRLGSGKSMEDILGGAGKEKGKQKQGLLWILTGRQKRKTEKGEKATETQPKKEANDAKKSEREVKEKPQPETQKKMDGETRQPKPEQKKKGEIPGEKTPEPKTDEPKRVAGRVAEVPKEQEPPKKEDDKKPVQKNAMQEEMRAAKERIAKMRVAEDDEDPLTKLKRYRDKKGR